MKIPCFASRKAVVLPERTYLLDKIAELAKKYKDYPIVVEGYTDSRGRNTNNLALSQSRAQSVLDYLVQQKKLKFERVKSSGYGEANPVADNSTADGRAKNRRVEVIFLSSGLSIDSPLVFQVSGFRTWCTDPGQQLRRRLLLVRLRLAQPGLRTRRPRLPLLLGSLSRLIVIASRE